MVPLSREINVAISGGISDGEQNWNKLGSMTVISLMMCDILSIKGKDKLIGGSDTCGCERLC